MKTFLFLLACFIAGAGALNVGFYAQNINAGVAAFAITESLIIALMAQNME